MRDYRDYLNNEWLDRHLPDERYSESVSVKFRPVVSLKAESVPDNGAADKARAERESACARLADYAAFPVPENPVVLTTMVSNGQGGWRKGFLASLVTPWGRPAWWWPAKHEEATRMTRTQAEELSQVWFLRYSKIEEA